MKALLNLIYERTGIRLGEENDAVVSKIKDYFAKRGVFNAKEFFTLADSDPACFQEVENLLTINETYFFREKGVLEAFVRLARNKKGDFRVLCAPCSTGEEAYSIAILLEEAGISRAARQIYAIDVNSAAIALAKKGEYGGKSLFCVAPSLTERFFDPLGGGAYAICADMRGAVNFVKCSLFDPTFNALGAFDFVFCRNLLIYFDEASREKAEAALFNRLKAGGYLFIGHADFIKNSVGFTRLVEGATTYYRRPEA
jgi:chemotaxis protein methyltransferase CheR